MSWSKASQEDYVYGFKKVMKMDNNLKRNRCIEKILKKIPKNLLISLENFFDDEIRFVYFTRNAMADVSVPYTFGLFFLEKYYLYVKFGAIHMSLPLNDKKLVEAEYLRLERKYNKLENLGLLEKVILVLCQSLVQNYGQYIDDDVRDKLSNTLKEEKDCTNGEHLTCEDIYGLTKSFVPTVIKRYYKHYTGFKL